MDDGPSTVSTQVHRLPGEQHASQPRIQSLEQLLAVTIFHFMCYDPMSKDHPLDGYTHLENVCVQKVQGQTSFFASLERRGLIAPGDAQKATVNTLIIDAFPLLMQTIRPRRRRRPPRVLLRPLPQRLGHTPIPHRRRRGPRRDLNTLLFVELLVHKIQERRRHGLDLLAADAEEFPSRPARAERREEAGRRLLLSLLGLALRLQEFRGIVGFSPLQSLRRLDLRHQRCDASLPALLVSLRR